MWFKRRPPKNHIEDLAKEHTQENIRSRIQKIHHPDYLRDAVLGGIDGCVTTFAVVAGTLGGNFPGLVALALGFSNLIADGFSMAVSNFQATKSVSDKIRQIREIEEQHIQIIPEGEKDEIRQIFAQKGFEGEMLDKIVKVVSSNHTTWIDTMIQEEYGLPLNTANPYRAALTTFCAFVFIGIMPLIPFFFALENMALSFSASVFLTALAFFAIGAIKGKILGMSVLGEAFKVLLSGGLAAGLAYIVSYWITSYYGVLL